eukprot:tig00000403_g311.t1
MRIVSALAAFEWTLVLSRERQHVHHALAVALLRKCTELALPQLREEIRERTTASLEKALLPISDAKLQNDLLYIKEFLLPKKNALSFPGGNLSVEKILKRLKL